jgi:hypothetical protein
MQRRLQTTAKSLLESYGFVQTKFFYDRFAHCACKLSACSLVGPAAVSSRFLACFADSSEGSDFWIYISLHVDRRILFDALFMIHGRCTNRLPQL